MNITLSGGHGFLGQSVTQYFSKSGHRVLVLPRSLVLGYDEQSRQELTQILDNTDVLINLSGKSVDCRYNEKNKQMIYASRLDTTKNLGTALSNCKRPPAVWMNASSATIYRHSLDMEMDEFNGEIGSGFSVDVCQKWEKEFFHFDTPRTRKVALRTAIVLGRNRGAFMPLKRLVKLGLGGRMGDGNQYFSWLHEDDFVRILEFIIINNQLSGVVNLAAPNPIPNDQFMSALRKAAGVSFGLPNPRWLLELGAILIRTETELILKSRRVVPGKLSKAGYSFRFNTIEHAFADLLKEQK